jgi:hypothetical protein
MMQPAYGQPAYAPPAYAPPPVYAQPAPVYMPPPAPTIMMAPPIMIAAPAAKHNNSQAQCMGQINSANIECNSCDAKTMTRTTCSIGSKQWMICYICCVLSLFGVPTICCCLGCYLPQCYEYRHYCSDCGMYAGTSMTGNRM